MPTPKETDNELNNVSKKISFFAINPNNEQAEKKKFFKSKTYEPQLLYNPYKENIEQLQEELKEINPDNSEIGKLLKQSRNIYYSMLNMIKYRGDSRFTKYSILVYGIPDKELIRKAKYMLKTLKVKRTKENLTSKQVISRMRYAFMKYGFKWGIKERDMAASAAVKNTEKELLIKRDGKFSKKFLKRLIVHEIGTHIVRYENGSYQPYKIFMRGLPNYLMTEEGLAVVNEEMNGCLDNTILKRYASRVVAVDMATKYGFRKVYNHLRKYLDKDLAWRTTIRVKRGLEDTSKPGGCTKDYAYLRGYFAVKKFIEDGGDIQKLYYGKIGIQHVDMLKRIDDLVEPKLLPAFRYLRYFIEHFEGLLKGVIILDFPPFNITFRFIKKKFGNGNIKRWFNGK
jgi:uncharacterized protein (TIGR02421 family)